MRKLILFAGLLFMIILTACSSAESKEVLKYHNDFADFVNPKMDEIEELFDQIVNAQTDEEAIEIQKEKVTPLIKEVKEYVDAQKPETDVTKEYHDLISKWATAWHEAVEMENEAFTNLLNESISEEEAYDLLEKSEQKATEAEKYDKEAEEKWEELRKEYDFEEVEE